MRPSDVRGTRQWQRVGRFFLVASAGEGGEARPVLAVRYKPAAVVHPRPSMHPDTHSLAQAFIQRAFRNRALRAAERQLENKTYPEFEFPSTPKAVCATPLASKAVRAQRNRTER